MNKYHNDNIIENGCKYCNKKLANRYSRWRHEQNCKIKKEKIFCERRNFAKVDSKCQKDIVWIIWDIFLKESEKRSKITQKIMSSLLSLFCLKYTTGCHKKRKNIFTSSVKLDL
jgi:hypothetical protein